MWRPWAGVVAVTRRAAGRPGNGLAERAARGKYRGQERLVAWFACGLFEERRARYLWGQ
jgi:hypothetical protein